MKQAERKKHVKEIKRRQKARRKQNRQPAQPATQQEKVMEPNTNEPVFNETEVRTALRGALETVLKVMRMVNKAIDSVDETDADKVFAARVTAQRKRDDFQGVRSDENSVIRLHPLYLMWKLADQCARQVEKLLRLTNPKEFAKWKAEADKAAKDAAKLAAKVEKAAA